MTRTLTQKRIVILAVLVFVISMVVSGAGRKFFSTLASSKQIAQPKTERLSVEREATAKTSIKLSNVRTIAAGANSENAIGAALGLVSADFNEDGTPDVVTANGAAGLGAIRIFRGNLEAIYGANSLTNSAEPFFGNPKFLALSATPDFIEAGDFNGDAHQDLLFAAKLGNKIFLLAGDGKGSFDEAKEFSVNGEITAMTAGEFNHHDSVVELAIAIQSDSKFEILLYQNFQGAINAEPKHFALASSVTALTLGQMNNDFVADLAAASGNNLYLIEARDEALTVATQVLPFAIQAMAVGRFDTLAQDQLAVLAENDEVYAMRAPQAQTGVGRRRAADRLSREWRAEKLISNVAATESISSSSGHKTLLRTRTSTSAFDDFVILDSSRNSLNILSKGEVFESTKISFESENAIVAALPMRLNGMALNGLVMFRHGQSSLEYVVPEAAMTFTVNSMLDIADNNPGDGVCGAFVATGSPLVCTLRAAIQEANANAGADTIQFSIGSGIPGINLLTALPTITEAVTINGLPRPVGQPVTLTRTATSFGCNPALNIVGGNSLVRGLYIAGSACSNAIRLANSGNNFIESNQLLNSGDAVIFVENSPNNTIGGTLSDVTGVNNIIGGGSTAQILIAGSGSVNNVVLGNSIFAGSTNERRLDGIVIAAGSNNRIGSVGIGNDIVSYVGSGIVVVTNYQFGNSVFSGAANGNVIQANRVTGGGSTGIFLNGANNTVIGRSLGVGGTVNSGNEIAGFSKGIVVTSSPVTSGVPIPNGVSNSILGNIFFSNSVQGIDLADDGFTANDVSDGDTGANNLQNFPILSSAISTPTGVNITGTLNSTANTQFTIEFFGSASGGNRGQPEQFLGSTTVTTNTNGNANISYAANIGTPVLLSRGIYATATDPNGNTSEFSASVAARSVADLSVTQSVAPNPALSTNAVTYTITVTNDGPSVAQFVSLTINPPAQLLNPTCTAPNGWFCSQDGAFYAATFDFAPGTSTLTIRGTLPCLSQNTTLVATANVSTSTSSTTDPNTTNNSSTLNTSALAGTAVGTITYDGTNPNALSLGPVVVGSGNAVSGTFTLENTGCLPMNLTTAQFQRQLNAAVPNLGLIDDARYFSVRIINADLTETPLNPAGTDRDPVRLITLNRILNPAQKLRFRVLFNPPLPFFAGTFARSDLGLNANQVLPSQFNSRLSFSFITQDTARTAGGTFAALVGNTSPAVQIIPRDGLVSTVGAPLVVLEQIREDFRVKVSMYDSNKNINKITYQFIDTFNQLVGKPIEVALTQPLSASAILPGQCFTLQLDFVGSAARPDVTKVRVVVTDDDGTSVTAGSSGVGAFASPATVLLESLSPQRSDVIALQPIKLSFGGRTDSAISRDNNSQRGNQ